MIVVANSTPLIYFAMLSDFDLLRELFGAITIPQAVFEEVVTEGKGQPGEKEVRKARWIQVVAVKNQHAVQPLIRKHRMHRGEGEAILLYQQLRAQLLLLDEQRAVEYARGLGMNVMRTGGIYVEAKRLGLIEAIRGRLDQLRQEGFWLKERDYERILKEAGE
jgi:uncharacterized protein